jgi:hypothetical protein
MRVYHDVSPSDAPTTAKLNRLTDQYKHILDTCYVGDLPHYGNVLGEFKQPFPYIQNHINLNQVPSKICGAS